MVLWLQVLARSLSFISKDTLLGSDSPGIPKL
ncbi:unnamed protein product [Debaryomyces fabryi]|nr:unnamed protein product [Debaryomyces fabryi]